MKLYVIRHGETLINAKEIINSINCVGLNKKGKMQAEEAGIKVRELDIDLILCSPLRRAVQTCRIINKNKIKVIYDRRLMERNAGNMQFKKNDSVDLNVWYDITKERIYKNSEGFKSLLERAGKVIEHVKTKYPDKNILFSTHGDMCKAIYAYINKISDVEKIIAYKVDNCYIR